MKRFLALTSFFMALLAVAPAICAEAESGEAGHHEEGNKALLWQIGNFVVLAGGLGYLIYKKGGPFFAGRSAEIRKGLEESAAIKADSEARYSEMERRLAGLAGEIDKLRVHSNQESEAEAERMRAETAREIAKVQAQATQEIESAGKAARMELRVHAAELAVELAERRIRTEINPDSDKVLVNAMLKDLAGRSDGPSQRVS